MAVNGIALGAIAAGSVLLYSALLHKNVLSVIESVIKGDHPSSATASMAGASTGVVNPDVTDLLNPGGVQPSALPAGNVTVYSQAQLQSLWVMAGGSQASKQNAACHGIQESSGNPLVTSPNPDGGTNVGLWQLDTPGGEGAGYTVAELQNALTNARVTVARTRDGADWSAWATPGC